MAGVLRCFLVRIDEVPGRNEASLRSLAFPICRCLRAAEGFLLAVAWGFDGGLVAPGEEPAGRACGTPPTGPHGVRETQSPCGTYGFPLAPSRRSPSSKGKRDSTASKNSLASRESPSLLDIIFFSLRNDGVPA